MKKYCFLVSIIFSLTFNIYSQNKSSGGVIQYTDKPVNVIEYHGFDGSILERYDRSNSWVVIKQSEKPNPFINTLTTRKIYEYTNLKGETFETYDFKNFRPLNTTNQNFEEIKDIEEPSDFAFSILPNPVDDGVITIQIFVPARTKLTLIITDILGFEVQKIVLGEVEKGTHLKKIKNELSTGFYRFILTNYISSKEIITLIK